METKSVKLQGTVTGHAAWVVEQLMVRKRETLANITAYAFNRWIDSDDDMLAKYKLTLADFEAFTATEEGGEAEILNYPDKNA